MGFRLEKTQKSKLNVIVNDFYLLGEVKTGREGKEMELNV